MFQQLSSWFCIKTKLQSANGTFYTTEGYTPAGSKGTEAGEAAPERSSADSDTLRDGLECISIIFSGLISKTEEGEEDEGAENHTPASGLQAELGSVILRITP